MPKNFDFTRRCPNEAAIGQRSLPYHEPSIRIFRKPSLYWLNERQQPLQAQLCTLVPVSEILIARYFTLAYITAFRGGRKTSRHQRLPDIGIGAPDHVHRRR